jgi:cytochrome c556
MKIAKKSNSCARDEWPTQSPRGEGEGEANVVTTAVWRDEEAFENAKKAMLMQFRNQGTDPAEIMKAVQVRGSRSTYSRLPY